MKKTLIILIIFMLVIAIPSSIAVDEGSTTTDTGSQATEPASSDTPVDTTGNIPSEDPAVTEPAPTEPIVTEPSPTEPVVTESTPTEPAPIEDSIQSSPGTEEQSPSEGDGLVAGASASAIAESSTDDTSASVVTGATVTDNSVETFAYAEAQGDNIVLTSAAYAEGPIVRGAGASVVTGDEESDASVQIIAKVLDNGYNSLTIISVAHAKGNAQGYTWAWAWAEFIPDAVQQVKHYARSSVFGGTFIFGRSDVERYTYFKYKYINESNSDSVRSRAKYFMKILANDYGLNETQFENKFDIVVNKLDKDIKLVSFDKVNNTVVIEVSGNTYDIPIGTERNINGRIIRIMGIDDKTKTVRFRVVLAAPYNPLSKNIRTNISMNTSVNASY